MKTIGAVMTAANSAVYWGEHGDWLLAYSTHRDAGTLDRANWDAFARCVGDAGDEGEDWAVEEASHWAVGWIRHLLVRPGTACEGAAQECLDSLEQYPVLDEEELSRVEEEECLGAAREATRQYLVRHDYRAQSTRDWDSDEIAICVYGLAPDSGPDSVGDRGADEWWPSDRLIWAGVLAWARRQRKGGA